MIIFEAFQGLENFYIKFQYFPYFSRICTNPDTPTPTSTVVIIDILLRTRAAMHTTIAAAAVWQFEASLSEANCQ